MRFYLVGEGPTDIGDLASLPGYRTGQEGFFQPLIRQLLPPGVVVDFDGAKLGAFPREPVRDAQSKLGRQAAQAHALASDEGFDVLVITHDVDRTSSVRASPREAATKMAEVYSSIAASVEAAAAELDDPYPIQWVVGTPCRCVEAWVLGDLDAVDRDPAVDLPARISTPEELTGAPHDPASDHPKMVLNRLRADLVTDDYALIGEALDVGELSRSCPLSFVPFAEAVAGLVTWE